MALSREEKIANYTTMHGRPPSATQIAKMDKKSKTTDTKGPMARALFSGKDSSGHWKKG